MMDEEVGVGARVSSAGRNGDEAVCLKLSMVEPKLPCRVQMSNSGGIE